MSIECPVVIHAYAVVKESNMESAYAQIKYQNLSSKTIIAMMVSLELFDISGERVSQACNYQYLDLKIQYGEIFGSKVLIPLPLHSVRKYIPRIIKIIYSDDTVWDKAEAEWHDCSYQKKLQDELSQLEIEEYRSQTSTTANFMPDSIDAFWRCSCGAVNAGDNKCLSCGCTRFNVFSALNKESLAKSIEEKEREKKKAKEIAKKKNKRNTIWASSLFTAVLATIVLFNTVIVPRNKYKNALDLLAKNNFEEAYALFSELGKMDDIAKSKMTRAKEAINQGHFEYASTLLENLNYQDSRELYQSIQADRLKESLRNIQKGDSVFLGKYEQDGKESNGKEAIEWILISKNKTEAILISKYCIEQMVFNDQGDNSWENSIIRRWLNNEFYSEAFSDTEKELIKSNGGEYATLLSRSEAERYMTQKQRKTSVTQYLQRKVDLYYWDSAFWWLKSSGIWPNGKKLYILLMVAGG